MKLVNADALIEEILKIQAAGAADSDYKWGAAVIETTRTILGIIDSKPDALKDLWRAKIYEGKNNGSHT